MYKLPAPLREQSDFVTVLQLVAGSLKPIDRPAVEATAKELMVPSAGSRLADRFGTNVVYRTDDFNKPPGTRLAPTLDFLDDRALDPCRRS
jgi:hypothetical protein